MVAIARSDAPPGDVFCEIVAAGDPDVLVHADDDVVVLLDRAPLVRGHALVVPRRHVVTIDQLAPDELAALMVVVQRCVVAVQAAFDAEGAFVANNNLVSQSVPHLHVHVVPRRPGDGLRGFFWPRHRYADEGERRDHAARLRAALATGDA